VSPAPGDDGLFGSVLAIPLEKRDFVLTDQHGDRFRFVRDTADADVTLLYFGYTHCPDICPDTMAKAAVALRALPGDVAGRVAVVFVTVDPARDDPDRLRVWIGTFGEDFVGVTGSQDAVDAIQRSFGYEPAPRADLGGGEYTVGHPAEVLVFTDDGLAHLVFPHAMGVEQWEADLLTLVNGGWQG
jgi:protein SCO1/2